MNIDTNLSMNDLLNLIEKTKREIAVLEYDAIEKCNVLEQLIDEFNNNREEIDSI